MICIENYLGSGARSLSEALKKNPALTLLNLKSEVSKEEKSKWKETIWKTENCVRAEEVRSISEALVINTTLTLLDLSGRDKKKKKKKTSKKHRWMMLWNQIENYIQAEGAKSLSEALTKNTSLIQLNLGCVDLIVLKEKCWKI